MTANPQRGEVDLTVDDTPYVLQIRTRDVILLEKITGETYGDLVNKFSRVSYTALRAMLFAFLQAHHGKAFTKIEQVDDLMDRAGGHRAFMAAILELFDVNRPPSAATKGEPGGDENPPDAPAGTGDSSVSTAGASA